METWTVESEDGYTRNWSPRTLSNLSQGLEEGAHLGIIVSTSPLALFNISQGPEEEVHFRVVLSTSPWETYNTSLGLEEQARLRLTRSWSLWFAVALFLFMMLVVCSNFLVMAAIFRRPELKTPSNFYIFNLALMDALIGVNIIFKIYYNIDPSAFDSLYMCLLKIFLTAFLMVMSIILLAGIAVDRAMAVGLPFSYKALVTPCRTALVIGVMWVYAFCVSALPPLLGLHNWQPGHFCRIVNIQNKYMSYSMMVHTMISLVVIIIAYTMLFKISARHLKEIATLDLNIQHTVKANLLRHLKAAKTLLLVIGAFMACWLPFAICVLYVMLAYPETQANALIMVRKAVAVLLYVNGVVNPFIYAGRMREFRREFIRMLTCGRYSQCFPNQVAPLQVP